LAEMPSDTSISKNVEIWFGCIKLNKQTQI
jgi:hypothetical protein